MYKLYTLYMCNTFICAAVHLKGKSEKVVEIFFILRSDLKCYNIIKEGSHHVPPPLLSLSLYIYFTSEDLQYKIRRSDITF